MKRTCLQHTKLKRLTEMTGCKVLAVGLLESLWQYAAREAPCGDIGRKPDEYIAAGMEWKGDPEKMIGWLVDAGFVDRSSRHRLVIHDWHEHAEDSVKKWVHRNKLSWASIPDDLPETPIQSVSVHVATSPDISGNSAPALANAFALANASERQQHQRPVVVVRTDEREQVVTLTKILESVFGSGALAVARKHAGADPEYVERLVEAARQPGIQNPGGFVKRGLEAPYDLPDPQAAQKAAEAIQAKHKEETDAALMRGIEEAQARRGRRSA